ncbi:N-acetylmuramoyl-L-alanine amidase [Salicibibacter cibarius]|uniref:Autolysin n=1 Tax=Salicibibacter cibarius TaxID=2743000 RepID=A0A7T6Z1V8_9BACI|nr:N-acetylmuramoyl-L-alanine amidase [Salicibibacter cibarius]QQK75171.1 N-acetylmuramoyl-L-alanine amidase [Salicibibacter cibarius]
MAHPSWGLMDTHTYHRDTLGWAGIGYNYLILRSGTIYEGRGDHVGAHASGYNSTYIGVALTGDFETGSQTPTSDQMDSLYWLIPELKKTYPNADNIVGHYDLGQTSCPGRRFPMSEFKRNVGSGGSGGSAPRYGDNNESFANYHSDWWGRDDETVKTIQRLLQLVDELPSGSADSIFGQQTLDAVRSFQDKHSLSQSGANFYGVPGPATLEKLAEEGNTTAAMPGDVVRMIRSFNYRSRANWADDAIAGTVSEGEAFTVVRRAIMSHTGDLYEIKSGNYISVLPSHVEVVKQS